MIKKIKGVNLGGWLLMEGYILGGRNIAEHQFKKQFTALNGVRQLAGFEKSFRNTFITPTDFKAIARLGATVVRLPFNCRLIETKPYRYSREGLAYLIKALDWAQSSGVKIILDMHAAVGAQNCDWHGDSAGKALLWDNPSYRERTCAIWEYIVTELKNHPALEGYDILNEPVLDAKKVSRIRDFYRQVVRRIKKIDSSHTIYLEGNTWAQQIDFLEDVLDDGVAVSIHTYQPLLYTFNYSPGLKFPGIVENQSWNKKKVCAYLEPYAKFSQKHKVDIFVGEFGINWRGGQYGELAWLDDILTVYDDFGFGYCYWTYKAVANHVFPDGVLQYTANGPFVRREGPVYGWENYPSAWKSHKAALCETWKSSNYTENKPIARLLKTHFSR